jgi:D-tyrosyl-tRNA(Tyr) deacylase
MRIVVQRTTKASVEIEGAIHGKINHGLVILVGVEELDSKDDALWLIGKLNALRVFNDEAEKMNLSIQDIHGAFLVISQFTLHASTKKGNRPSYIRAAKPEIAVPLYEFFIEQLKEISGLNVETGKFGADMKVSLINDGPVTIIIDSKNKE